MRVNLRNGNDVFIDVVRKNVSNVTLRVYPGGNVRVTVPHGMSEHDARSFVESHIVWLERRLLERVNHDPDGTIRLEGNVMILENREIERGARVEALDERLVVSGPTHAARQKALDKWWRSRVLSVCSKYLSKWYPVLAQHGCAEPEISVRKMRSAWGSCTPKTGRIRFNYYLICAAPREIEYVVLHELAHLAYPNHGRRFAAFMTEHMPDWKDRRDTLNRCTRYIDSF